MKRLALSGFLVVLSLGLLSCPLALVTPPSALGEPKLLFTLISPNPQAGAQFGRSVRFGDTDGNGVQDVFVSAPFEDLSPGSDEGRVYLFSGKTGKLVRVFTAPTPQKGSLVGMEVGPCMRAVVGAPGEDVAGNVDEGRAYVFDLLQGGKVLHTLSLPIAQAGAKFGSQACSADLDKDGVLDALVSAPGEDVGGMVDQGRVYGFSGVDGSLLLVISSPTRQAGSAFGVLLVVEKELIGALGPRIAVGAPGESVAGKAQAGRVYVFAPPLGGLLPEF